MKSGSKLLILRLEKSVYAPARTGMELLRVFVTLDLGYNFERVMPFFPPSVLNILFLFLRSVALILLMVRKSLSFGVITKSKHISAG